MEEIWRYVPGYERLYEVSNTGKVRKADGKEMAGNLNSYGYRVVSLTRNGKKKDKKVHRLVAMAFIDQIPGKDFVNHKDGNKTNNAVWNLEWVTRGENNRHAREVLHANYSKKEVVKLDGDFRRLSEYESRSKAGKSVGAKNGFLIGACCLGTAKTAPDEPGRAVVFCTFLSYYIRRIPRSLRRWPRAPDPRYFPILHPHGRGVPPLHGLDRWEVGCQKRRRCTRNWGNNSFPFINPPNITRLQDLTVQSASIFPGIPALYTVQYRCVQSPLYRSPCKSTRFPADIFPKPPWRCSTYFHCQC